MLRLPRSKPARAVSTANVVVTCGAIVVVVVTGFVIDPDVVVKMLCVGIIVGSLVDTLIVRMVQAPAATAGLGAVNWWTPNPRGAGTSLTAGRNGAAVRLEEP
jgi:uncharacterized membrane protein YdfJ with MMPL/SSD domain